MQENESGADVPHWGLVLGCTGNSYFEFLEAKVVTRDHIE